MLKEGLVDAEEVADTNSKNDNNRESEAMQWQQNQVEPDIVILDGKVMMLKLDIMPGSVNS